MLAVYGFERVAVAVGDLYFVDPDPIPGQEGAERGARVELRLLERGELPGSIYSAQPISIGRPVWRVDLFESVAGTPGSFDRAHHHPDFDGWEPGPRRFEEELSADPLGWLGGRLSRLDRLLADVGAEPSVVSAGEVDAVREAVPDIVGTVARMLGRVRAGELATPQEPSAGGPGGARVGWL